MTFLDTSNNIPAVQLKETTVPSNPSAGYDKLYIDTSDHHLKHVNSSGTVKDLESASGLTGTVAVNQGGTGDVTLPAHDMLIGNGTSPITGLAPGATRNVAISDGTDWASRAITPADVPTFVASGGGHAAGIVPDPGASAATTHFLREDATWAIPPDTGITTLTGDIAAGPGSGSQAATLATVLSTPGSFTLASITANAKGLITAIANGVVALATQVSGLLGLVNGGTGADLSGTGGSGEYLKQSTVGGVVTVGVIPAADYPNFIASGGSHAKGAVPDPGSSAGTAKFLREDATWSNIGPATSTDHGIARYDGATGTLLEDSIATVDDSGNIDLHDQSLLRESYIEGKEVSVPSSPSAGYQRIYIDTSDHRLKRVNSSGAIVPIEMDVIGIQVFS